MDIDEYQKWTRSSVRGKSKDELALYGMGLAGEAGEVVDILKKIIRSDGVSAKGSDSSIQANAAGMMQLELGDVLWYVARIADYYGVPLSEVLKTNVRKLSVRYDLKGDANNE